MGQKFSYDATKRIPAAKQDKVSQQLAEEVNITTMRRVSVKTMNCDEGRNFYVRNAYKWAVSVAPNERREQDKPLASGRLFLKSTGLKVIRGSKVLCSLF